MTDIIVIDIPDWQDVTAIEPVTVEVIEVDNEAVITAQAKSIIVALPMARIEKAENGK